MKAEIIIIGDEILNGTTLDTNSRFISGQLDTLHIEVTRRSTIKDDASCINQALYDASHRANLILTTGGLGPTKDDITKQTIANFFQKPLIESQEVLAHVKSFFKRRNKEIIAENLKQALIPEGAEILHNAMGTAPGMWIEKDGKIFVFMPGVPFETQSIVANELIPKLGKLRNEQVILHEYLYTVGEGESYIAQKITDIEDALPPHISLAYLPSPGIVKLRLSAVGEDEAQLLDELQSYKTSIRNRLGDIVFTDKKQSLSAYIGTLMHSQNKWLGSVESCTSGAISQAITHTPGSSAYYGGSLITYSYEMKERLLGIPKEDLLTYGAVSQEIIELMASKGREKLRVDYVIATSGIAGPGGGTESKPVGTVWIAVADANRVVSKKFKFGSDRTRNIELTKVYALDMLRRFNLNL